MRDQGWRKVSNENLRGEGERTLKARLHGYAKVPNVTLIQRSIAAQVDEGPEEVQ